MRSNQAVLLCVVTFLAVAAILGGQFVTYRHFEQLRQASSIGRQASSPLPLAEVTTDSTPPLTSVTPADGLPTFNLLDESNTDVHYFPFEPGAGQTHVGVRPLEVFAEATPADGFQTGGPELLVSAEPVAAVKPQGERETPLLLAPPDTPTPSGDVPERLPGGDAAAPILPQPPHSPADERRRALIVEQFPDAGPEMQEIWLEELKGLPLDVVRDILRMRRNFGEAPEMSQVPIVITPQPAAQQRRLHDGREDLFASERRLFDDLAAGIPAMLTDIHSAQCVVLNNIANAATDGFKRSQVFFEDLHYDHWKTAGMRDANGQLTATGISVGWGSRLSTTMTDHTQGELRTTGRPLHVAIAGPGFFQVQGEGEILYTRCGRFCLNADGSLVLSSAEHGRLLEPAITLPLDATDIHISAEGTVTFALPHVDDRQPAGEIMLVTFANPEGLEQRGGCLFAESAGSGPPMLLQPGVNACGELLQGRLERSNVDVALELAELRRLRQLSNALRSAVRLMEPQPAGGTPHSPYHGGSGDAGIATRPGETPVIAPRLATEAAESDPETAQQ